MMRYRRDASGEIVAEEKDEVPASKEEGNERWRKQTEMRFLRGDDEEFDYGPVDDGEEYDGPEESQEIEEKWFEEEQEGLAPEVQGSSLQGETGIQDY